ncbi:MAG: RNA polymerase sigma factor [Fimbriimonadaceae bacterium]|nr:RNA polymerase sigma factor [Fimbriimonadaceae bacterium]
MAATCWPTAGPVPGTVPGTGWRLDRSALTRLLCAAALPADEAADQRDVPLAQGGDPDAFERLVRRHQGAVGRLLWRFTRVREDHEELLQETFVTVWQRLAQYDGRGRFGNWVRQVAVRQGYDHWRRQGRQPVDYRDDLEELAGASLAAGPDQTVAAADLVHRLLSQLNPRDRLVITLLHLEGCSVAEAAALTGWSQTMVKVQAHRARAKLRRRLPTEER